MEKDFLASLAQEGNEDSQEESNSVGMEVDEGESDSEPEATLNHIIKIIPNLDNIFNGISNLTALRLLNDASIRHAPSPPAGVSRVKPSNRLIDKGGLQEINTGKTIWVYDGHSNTDERVRLVSQQGDIYGTAT